jgi:hypothetical protein
MRVPEDWRRRQQEMRAVDQSISKGWTKPRRWFSTLGWAYAGVSIYTTSLQRALVVFHARELSL